MSCNNIGRGLNSVTEVVMELFLNLSVRLLLFSSPIKFLKKKSLSRYTLRFCFVIVCTSFLLYHR